MTPTPRAQYWTCPSPCNTITTKDTCPNCGKYARLSPDPKPPQQTKPCQNTNKK